MTESESEIEIEIRILIKNSDCLNFKFPNSSSKNLNRAGSIEHEIQIGKESDQNHELKLAHFDTF